MIELQRARLLATGKGASSSPAAAGAQPTQPSLSLATHPNMTSTATAPVNPQQAAAARVHREDELMQRFLQQLQHRDDSRAESKSGPTVPTALSRRILQKQGVGYLDDTVGAIASAAADRFIATVLQQAIACRDQRLKGVEEAKEAAKHRKRHLEHYQADQDDRERRKTEILLQRGKNNLAVIEAAETLKKEKAAAAAAGPSEDGDVKTKKKKSAAALNGANKRKRSEEDGDEEASYDSIDEEEEYYQEYYGNDVPNVDDEDDEDDMIILRDIVQPLEAWDFYLAGKEGLEPTQPENGDADVDDMDVDDDDDLAPLEDPLENAVSESAMKEAPTGSDADKLQDKTKPAESGNAPAPAVSKPAP